MADKPASSARMAKLEKKVAAIVDLLRLNGLSIPKELE